MWKDGCLTRNNLSQNCYIFVKLNVKFEKGLDLHGKICGSLISLSYWTVIIMNHAGLIESSEVCFTEAKCLIGFLY